MLFSSLFFSTFKKKELEYGFELMVVKTKSRTRLEVVHSGPCPSKELKLLSTQRIYLRPIQQSIAMTECCPPSSQATLNCYICGEVFATSAIRDHVDHCKESVPVSQLHKMCTISNCSHKTLVKQDNFNFEYLLL